MGLLVLRIAIGLTGTIQGSLVLAEHSASAAESWSVGLALIGSGVLLLIGFLTPIASIVQGLLAVSFALTWVAAPLTNLFVSSPAVALLVAVDLALALLGPGSVSIDRRIFGRREIIIPRMREPLN